MNWNSGRILFALAQYLDWWQNTLMTEVEIDGRREDLVMITKAGYATCFEIKISRADWRVSKERDRFRDGMTHKYCSRFFYVVPFELFEKGVPEFVPEWVGILTVRTGAGGGYDRVREQRAAVRKPAEKLPRAQIDAIYSACYYRFWRTHMNIQRSRLFDRPRIRAAQVAA